MGVMDWANAIASIESAGSGDYSAIGPVTAKGNRAYGRYQVMDFNIGPWTEKHLGRRLTPEEFLASKEAQDAVFAGEFGGNVEKYGNPQDAASVWFTGKPVATGGNRKDILGTTGNVYVDKFNNALGQMVSPMPDQTTSFAPPMQTANFAPATQNAFQALPQDPFADMGLLSRLAASRGISQSADAAPISNLFNILAQKKDPRLAEAAKARGGFFGLLGG
jgi:hypothetical protein